MKYIDIKYASSEAEKLIAEETAQDLKEGRCVVFPTETVYGLACDMFNSNAVQKIYEIKGRDRTKPLPVMIGKIEDIEFVAKDIPYIFYEIAEKYMPGAVTVVLKKKDNVSDIITGGLDTVGIRMPDHPFALNMIKYFGNPIIATSANLSGHPSPKIFDTAYNDLKDLCDVFIDKGKCEDGLPSTIIDLSEEIPKILRQGNTDLSEYTKK